MACRHTYGCCAAHDDTSLNQSCSNGCYIVHHAEEVCCHRDAVRGEEIILLTQAQSGGALAKEGRTKEGRTNEGRIKEGRTKEDAACLSLLALVDKVERQKEVDGTRKLIAYVTVCLQGMQPCSPIRPCRVCSHLGYAILCTWLDRLQSMWFSSM